MTSRRKRIPLFQHLFFYMAKEENTLDAALSIIGQHVIAPEPRLALNIDELPRRNPMVFPAQHLVHSERSTGAALLESLQVQSHIRQSAPRAQRIGEDDVFRQGFAEQPCPVIVRNS